MGRSAATPGRVQGVTTRILFMNIFYILCLNFKLMCQSKSKIYVIFLRFVISCRSDNWPCSLRPPQNLVMSLELWAEFWTRDFLNTNVLFAGCEATRLPAWANGSCHCTQVTLLPSASFSSFVCGAGTLQDFTFSLCEWLWLVQWHS
jgi:hypothetical protein